MPRHVVIMWLLAGGGTLIGATLTYLATRPAFAAGVRLPTIWRRIRPLNFALFSDSNRHPSNKQHRASSGRAIAAPTTSAAFDEYREMQLAKLESEEREFSTFLQSLRDARDRHEFENFLQAKSGKTPSPSITNKVQPHGVWNEND